MARVSRTIFPATVECSKANRSPPLARKMEDRCADKARISLEQAQWLSILPERFEKTRRLFSGELDHAHFCDHNRPAENRADGESQQDDLPRDGGVLKSEQESAAREEDGR